MTRSVGATQHVADICRQIAELAGRLSQSRVTIMEVCGTHTVSIYRNGLKALLPERVRLISGPGCPVCVTPQGYIDAMIDLAGRDGVIVTTFGDMMRVPGTRSSLERQKASGADVRAVYSPTDALDVARQHPDQSVVFAAVGFETTAPTTASVLLRAEQEGIANFLLWSAHKLVVPAMLALLAGGEVAVDGFMCPGHVSVVIGSRAYEPVVRQYGKPCVVAGFEAPHILLAIRDILAMVVEQIAEVRNAYAACVSDDGNPAAKQAIDRVFEPADSVWRGLGTIPRSGLAIRPELAHRDAARVCGIAVTEPDDTGACRCADVLKGTLEPEDCGLFGRACTPTHPVGPCMVSSEGTCSAHFRYGRDPGKRL